MKRDTISVAMRKFLGVLFILLSTSIGLVVLLGWGIRTSILESEPWKTSLREARVYDRLLVEALPEIVSDKSVTGGILENAPLTTNDLLTIVQSTITAAFLQQQVEHGLDVAFALVQGRATLASTDFVIPLQDLKRRLPIAVHERLIARVQALPICTTDQLKDFEKFKTLTNALPPCRPKGLDVQAIVRDSLKVDEITVNIPATFDVVAELQKQRTSDNSAKAVETPQANDEKSKPTDKTQDNGNSNSVTSQQGNAGELMVSQDQQTKPEPTKTIAEQVADVQEQIQFAFRVHLYLTLAWLIILLGTGALFIPRWRRVGQWFSVGLFIPSVLVIGGTLYARGLLPDHFTVADRMAQIMANIGQPVAASLVHTASLRLLILGGTGVALAVVLFMLAFAFNRQRLKS